MAAFFRYTCLWQGCTKNCGSLLDLIDHIELVHIEKDPRILEKQEASQPAALPLSYVNCFFTEAARNARRKEQLMCENAATPDSTPKKKKSLTPSQGHVASSDNGETPEDEGNASDNSDDSWTTSDTFTSDLILNAITTGEGEGKRYICPIPGCGKRYKNVNGIKYHAKNGHKREGRVKKGFKCHCGKSYKSPSGLRHHVVSQHPMQNLPSAEKENLT